MFGWFKKKPKVIEHKIDRGEVITETGRVYMTVFEYPETRRIGFKFSTAPNYEILFDKKALPQLKKIFSKIS